MATNFSVSSWQGFKLWGLSPWLPSLADPCLTLAWASQNLVQTDALLQCNVTTLIRLAIVPPVSHSAVCSTCHASSSRPLSCSSPAICRPELQINKPSSIISPPPPSYHELTHLRPLCLLSVEGSRQVTGAMPHPFTTISPRSGSEHWVDCLITLHTLHSPGSCLNPLQEEPAFPGMGPIQGGAKYYSLFLL